MCGFLVSREGGDNTRIRLRGPDCTNTLEVGGFTFTHNLLNVTGAFTPQPFVDDDIVCVFNGEIYNQPYVRTDGEVLIPLYRKYGPSFVRELDGEFAIALYDFGARRAVFATDLFKTKPLFINGAACASYRSGVGGVTAAPNEIVVTDLDGTVLERMPVRTWDLTQHKDTYDDWIAAYEAAIRKRAVSRCFIGMSSGYDSGGIACELLRLGVDFKAYVYIGDEDASVLQWRLARVPHETFTPDRSLLPWLHAQIDNEPYTILCDGQTLGMRILDDGAALGVATMAQLAQRDGRKVLLSGQGADEIMSDYAPWPEQSELKGVYPEPLRLWRNFNFSCQESYLMKEEYAGGSMGIESRYPFLDGAVVQEFLWLTAEAKNRHYKAPLREYLRRHAFAFEENAKRGFKFDIHG